MQNKGGRFPLSNINIDYFIYRYSTTESSKGGTLKYKSRKDLNLNKPKEIESTFAEIIEAKKKLRPKRRTSWSYTVFISILDF